MMDSRYFDIVKRVWEEDRDSQTRFFNSIFEVRRSTFNPEGLNSIFIPNNDYLRFFMTPDCEDPSFGLYTSNGDCLWVGHMILPLLDVMGVPRGIVSFNPFVYLDVRNGLTGNYYSYSNKSVCQKGNFLYTPSNPFLHLDRPLVVVDGVFDALTTYEFMECNVGALLGSTITPLMIALMRLFPKVVLAMDNDEAGVRVRDKLRQASLPLEVLYFNEFKDIDEALKSEKTVLVQKEISKYINLDTK